MNGSFRRPYMYWTSGYNTGIESIDIQHRKFVEIINRAHGMVEAKIHPSKVKVLLEDIVDYANEHFSYEEGLMDRHKYPESEHHKMLHAIMRQEVGLLMARSVHGGLEALELLEYVKGWFHSHVNDTDHRYCDYLRSKGVR